MLYFDIIVSSYMFRLFFAKDLYDILEDPNTHINFGTMTDMLNVVPLIYELALSTYVCA